MASPELVFIHIPKAAGTSQQRAFNEHLGLDQVFWIGRDCSPDIGSYPRALIGERPVVAGHKRLAFFPRSFDPLYCAILRDPIERAISLFVYYTHPELATNDQARAVRQQLLDTLLAQGIEPDSMYRSIRNCRGFRRQISNTQCSYLSRGRATFSAVLRSRQPHDCIVGTMGQYPRYQHELWRLLDWADEEPVKVNRSKENYAARYLEDQALVELIASLNREDEKLVRWVESEHQGLWLQLQDAARRRRRLRRLPLLAAGQRASPWTWEDATDLWPARKPGRLQWPLSRMLVADTGRLLYMPIPGPLDVPIQRLMLRLSSVVHQDAVLQLGLERVVSHYATGLLLEDRSEAGIEAISAADDYFKFAIIYHPAARLVDIFRLRFVENRASLPRAPRLYRLLGQAQGSSEPDPRAGISFRQFVQAVLSGEHPHRLWLPQVQYLLWADTYDRLYRPDQAAELEADLGRITGQSTLLERGALDRIIAAGSVAGPARYADTPAGELPADPERWLDQLVDASLLAAIEDYYTWDVTLYNRSGDRQPEVAGA